MGRNIGVKINTGRKKLYIETDCFEKSQIYFITGDSKTE
jgi:hypothetical protein